jgi:hypothetical protein
LEVCHAQTCSVCIRYWPLGFLKGCNKGVAAFAEPFAHQLPQSFLIARKWMLTTDHQRIDPLGSMFGHAEPDIATHRIAPEVRPRDTLSVDHRHDIGYPVG